MTPIELAKLCDTLLNAHAFKDYCPNGLQIDADTPIRKVVTGVTACQALIDVAISEKADAILVHHGYFWKGENETLTGIKGKRIRTLLQHNISLLAYHLPLDAHATLGNNAQLAKQLGLDIVDGLDDSPNPIGNVATCSPISADDFGERIAQQLHRTPLHIAGTNKAVARIGLCTGAAQDMIELAHAKGCDTFISGEISERTTHLAHELGMHYFAAGHHATEMGGIRALGEYLADKHGLLVKFVNIDNPV
ncbi:MAG: Nif3-like dinuclear metal center hexameric protein [Moraxella sp.]|nr:Nif3-like dinuclear metal center hexameric protein [Moraxella sp.]